MEYYKDISSNKKGRIVGRKGPRDLQRQQLQGPVSDNSELIINELRSQVGLLMSELAKKPAAQEVVGSAIAKEYTAEEFDEELIKQVTTAVKDKEVEIERLKDQLKSKDEVINSKDETIQSLRLRGSG